MNLPNVLALLVIVVGIPLNATVTVMLIRRSQSNPKIKVLRERMIASAALLGLLAVFGLVFLNNDTLPPPLDLDITKIITRATMLVVAIVPAAYWLWLYLFDE